MIDSYTQKTVCIGDLCGQMDLYPDDLQIFIEGNWHTITHITNWHVDEGVLIMNETVTLYDENDKQYTINQYERALIRWAVQS